MPPIFSLKPTGYRPEQKQSNKTSCCCLPFLLFSLLIPSCLPEEEVHSRQKRILWITSDGRLALPPGTTMVISPSLSLPFVRYPPEGFASNLTVSLPFTIDFNKLGLTDNENPFGAVPPVLARSMGRAAGTYLADYIASFLDQKKNVKKKKKRSVADLPSRHEHAFHGGERALLYMVVEDLLENFGMDGKACLLRAICEVHAHPLTNFGLIGEMLKLFFTASKSPYASMLDEYVEAEKAGRGQEGSPSECWPYMKDCPKSLFLPRHKHYNSESDAQDNEVEVDREEDRSSKVTYTPPVQNM